MLTCKFCNKSLKNSGGLGSHLRSCKSNPDRNPWQRTDIPGTPFTSGNIPWNKGKTNLPSWNKGKIGIKGTPHTQVTKDRLSLIAKARNFGGYVRGSGRGKSGWYMGIYCDSSWELAYVIFCIEHNKNIKRNTEKRYYVYNNKLLVYIPDFIVDGKLIEIKGYVTNQWEAKIKYNPDVIVLYEHNLSDVFEYVHTKYGKNYINMYE